MSRCTFRYLGNKSILTSTRTAATFRNASRGLHTSLILSKQKLVVLGSGWAGYNVARQVNKSLYDVTVVSPNSYFSFTPFLASTAVGTLEYRCATEPVRGIKHVDYKQGWANNIDTKRKCVEVESALPPIANAARAKALVDRDEGISSSGSSNLEINSTRTREKSTYEIEYDKLVIAVGCYSASFGIPGVSKYAHFLKDIRDARAIRNTLLGRLEQACLPETTPEQRKQLLSIAIVGGGPTGVEFAAEVHDFVEEDIYRLYPHLRGSGCITLYDVAPHILGSFDASLRDYAVRKFARDKVAVKANTKILEVGPDWMDVAHKGEESERVPFGLLVWSTGLSPNPFIESLKGFARDPKTHGLRVNGHLAPLDEDGKPIPDVFAIGDNCNPDDGTKLPATAQVASQMAKWTSKTLNQLASGKELKDQSEFRWKNRGSMVFIGNQRAMVDRSSPSVQGVKSRVAGITAWIVWRSYYMTQTLGWRNKLLVPMYWVLAWFFGRDVTRF